MRNRAKCRLCNQVIESTHRHDMIYCSCGEIAIDGGPEYQRCVAKDWKNFIHVDDEGNERIESISHDPPELEPTQPRRVTREELIMELQAMIDNIEKLPPHVMSLPISHYDFVSSLILISSLFKTGVS